MLWEIHLLGILEAKAPDGRATVWSGTRAGLLLAYLALEPDKEHSRETLAEWLWPDGDPSTKRVRLRQEIATLRQLFDREGETGPLFVTRTSVTLRSSRLTTDIQQFDRAVAASRALTDPQEREIGLQEAIAVYRGDLLLAYPDHFLAERVRYSQQFDKVLTDLASLQRERGDYVGAVNTLDRLVTRDPIREEIHADLMRLYAALDEPSLVRRQYQELARLLKSELSEVPSESVRRLYLELRKEAADSIPLVPLPPKQESPLTAPSETPSSDQPAGGERSNEATGTEPATSEPMDPVPDKSPVTLDTTDTPAIVPATKETTGSDRFRRFPKSVSVLIVLLCLGLAMIALVNQVKTVRPDTKDSPPPLEKTGGSWVFYYKPRPGEEPNAEARAIEAIPEARYVAAGFIQTEKDDADFLTVFLDSNGRAYATDRYSSPERDCDRAFSVAADLQGGVFVAGETFVPGSPEAEGWYLTLIKYNEEGKRLWVRRSPVRTENPDHKVRVVSDGAGGAGIAGTAKEGDVYKILLLRYDPNGKLLWKQTLSAGNGKRTTLEDLRLSENPQEGFFVCGVAHVGNVENDLDSDWVVARFAPDGKQEWVRLVDGGANKRDTPVEILQNRVGHLYVGGTFTTAEGTQLAIARFSPEGEVYWKRASPASGPEVTFKTLGMEFFRGDYIYLAGEKRTPDQKVSLFIASYNRDGNMNWESAYLNPPNCLTVRADALGVTPAGNLVIGGQISSMLPDTQGWWASIWTAVYGPDGKGLTQQVLSEASSVVPEHKFGEMCLTLGEVFIAGQSLHDMGDVRFMVVKYPAPR